MSRSMVLLSAPMVLSSAVPTTTPAPSSRLVLNTTAVSTTALGMMPAVRTSTTWPTLSGRAMAVQWPLRASTNIFPSPAEPSSSLLPMALLAAAMPTSPTIPIPRPGPAMLISRPTLLPAAPPSAKSTCGKPITTLPPTTASHSPSIPSATSSATVLVTTFPRTSRLGLATPFWFSILPMPHILSITASTTASPSATNSATPSPLLI